MEKVQHVFENQHAATLLEAARHYRDIGLKYWNGMSDRDAQMRSMHNADYEDLCIIANLIEGGADKRSISLAIRNLDTAVRDEIPESVYQIYA
jgi:hypothetical protein